MTLEFLYLTQDPFINTTNKFVRILDILELNVEGVGGSLSGYSSGGNGALSDPNGNTVCYFFISQSVWNTQTDSTAYPVGFSGLSNVWSQKIILVPPGWKFSGFSRAIAVVGDLEEVLRVH
ncbi:MAG: hypothetical protein QW429_04000 [Thermoprotei archaeon]